LSPVLTTRRTPPALTVRYLGLCDYSSAWRAMRAFTDRRDELTPDELWVLQHRPVFTLGQAARREHIIADTGAIEVLQVDRGGQVTYHGPGQIIAYTLLDLRRLGLGIRGLVSRLEDAVVGMLRRQGLPAVTRAGAPGVYVGGEKIAALGLRVRRGCAYHGLSLNVAMDLSPFALIHPCGYRGLQVTQTSALGIEQSCAELEPVLAAELTVQLGYNALIVASGLPEAAPAGGEI